MQCSVTKLGKKSSLSVGGWECASKVLQRRWVRTNRNPGRLRTSPLDKERWEGTGGKEGIRVFQEEQCKDWEWEGGSIIQNCKEFRKAGTLWVCKLWRYGLCVHVAWQVEVTVEWIKGKGERGTTEQIRDQWMENLEHEYPDPTAVGNKEKVLRRGLT